MQSSFARVLALVGTSLLWLALGNAAQAAQVFTNNVGWFRADVQVYENTAGTDAAENGDGVAFWNDQSASSLDATQTTAGKRPTYVASSSLNSMPALLFSNAGGAGGTDVLSNAVNMVAAGSERTVLVAAVTGATDFGNTLFTFKTGGGGAVNTLAQMDIGGTYYVYSDGVAINQTITNALAEIKNPFVTSYKSAVGVPLGVDLNGTPRATAGGNTTSDISTGSGFSIGSRLDQPVGTYDWNGLIGEVIVYSRRLNAAENVIAMNYLSSKYGTTLVGSDRYAGDTLAAGQYDFEVFGVGQALAVSSGSAAGNVTTGTAGTGLAIAADVSTLGNGDYLLAGQQAGGNTITTADVPTGINTRWDRAWYVDKTGSLGATLSFDFSEAGLALPDPDDFPAYRLLYSTTDPFNFTDLNLTPTVVGDTISFTLTDAQLLSGYYTLGIVQLPEPGTWLMLSLGSLALSWQTRAPPHASTRVGQAIPDE